MFKILRIKLLILLALFQSFFCFGFDPYCFAAARPVTKPAAKQPVQKKEHKSNLVKQSPILDKAKKESMPPLAPDCKASKDHQNRNAQLQSSEKKSAPNTVSKKEPDESYLQQIMKLEQVMFADHSSLPGGKAGNGSLNDRVSRLEMALFGESKAGQAIPDRLKKLQESLFGSASPQSDSQKQHDTNQNTTTTQMPGIPPEMLDPGASPDPNQNQDQNWTDNTVAPKQAEFQIVESFLNAPDAQTTISADEMKLFALYAINAERQARGMSALEADALTDNMAKTHIADLASRRVISHTDNKGKNPDQRLTELGGADAVEECLSSITTGNLKSSDLNKMVAASLIKMMLERQDDREALMNPDATHLSMQFLPSSDGSEIFACAEVLTRKGTYESIPKEVSVSQDIHVEGTLDGALAFDRITLAYEELNEVPIEEDPGSKEALPYFPPLDFVAYRRKSEKDYSKLIFALKGLGVAAALAGGVFMPPVALAAPLIIMAGPGGMGGTVKPQSDIPIKGGVKVRGSNFSSKVSISNEGKPGIYYVTVWAISGNRSVPVSRRTVVARTDKDQEKKEESSKIEYTENVEAKEEPSQDAKR